MAESESEFDRGHMAGVIAARLAEHDKHFLTINGSLEKIAENQKAQTLAIQRLGDQAASAAATALTTAAALKEAEEARRDRSNQSWTPVSKALAIIGSAVAVIGLIFTIVFANR